MRRKKPGYRREHYKGKSNKGEPSKEKEKEKEAPICFECKKPGHFRVDCPQLKKASRKFKKKAMMATWSDSEDSTSEEEQKEVANLCFMANDDEVSAENLSDFTFNELEEAFFELMNDFKKLKLKNNKLNEKVLVLSNKEEKFSNEHEMLTQEIKCLKKSKS